jgi:flagellar basal-body rod modification protein FlgD
VTVSVKNEAGRVVQTFDLAKTTAGQQTIQWDGQTSGNERAAPGTYTFGVVAKDKAGNPVAADMSLSGVVTGVSYDNGAPELILGDTRIPLSNVSSIGQ